MLGELSKNMVHLTKMLCKKFANDDTKIAGLKKQSYHHQGYSSASSSIQRKTPGLTIDVGSIHLLPDLELPIFAAGHTQRSQLFRWMGGLEGDAVNSLLVREVHGGVEVPAIKEGHAVGLVGYQDPRKSSSSSDGNSIVVSQIA